MSGESNTQVEDMDEDSSSEESDEDSDDEPTKAVATVDSAPAVSQPPPPSLPTPGNVEVLINSSVQVTTKITKIICLLYYKLIFT